MSQTTESGKPTKLEWFGLFSGLIGLIADLIALTLIFRSVQISQVPLISSVKITSFTFWLIAFFGISYTVLILSFYTRRVLVARRRRYRRKVVFNSESAVNDNRATERAITAITLLIGMPLFLLHFILLFYIIRENILSLDSAHLEKFMGESDPTNVTEDWRVLVDL